MEADDKNWIPRGMFCGFVVRTVALAVDAITAGMLGEGKGPGLKLSRSAILYDKT